MAKKYEYEQDSSYTHNIAETTESYIAGGWELIAVHQEVEYQNSDNPGYLYRSFWKREKEADQRG